MRARIAPLAVVVARTVMSSNARASPLAASFNLAMTSECLDIPSRRHSRREMPTESHSFIHLVPRVPEGSTRDRPRPRPIPSRAFSHARAHARPHARAHDRDVRASRRLGDADDAREDRARARVRRETRGTISLRLDAIDDDDARG